MEHSIKYFGLNNVGLENDLRRVARDKKITLRPPRTKITEEIRHNAAMMAEHYELFYCLEVSIRDVIRAKLVEADKDWWQNLVQESVRVSAIANKKKEVETGVAPRSEDWLDYTNFGDLGQIISANWALFSDLFTDPKAVQNTLYRLNTLRAPIAHCSLLGEDEVLLLRYSLRAWFRLME